MDNPTLTEQVQTPVNLMLTPSEEEGVAFIRLQDDWLDVAVPFTDEASLRSAFETIKGSLQEHGPAEFVNYLPGEWLV